MDQQLLSLYDIIRVFDKSNSKNSKFYFKVDENEILRAEIDDNKSKSSDQSGDSPIQRNMASAVRRKSSGQSPCSLERRSS